MAEQQPRPDEGLPITRIGDDGGDAIYITDGPDGGGIRRLPKGSSWGDLLPKQEKE
jgi:hypothetical protein